MKRLSPSLALAVAALCSIAAPLQAQRAVPPAIDRGSIVIDGSASISHSNTTADGAGTDSESSSTQLSLLPSLLYFVAPRIAVGGSVELSRYSTEGVSSSTVGIGPAARLYLAGESAKVLPYFGASVRVTRVSLDFDSGASPPSSTRLGLEGVAGITWLFSRQVGILTEAFVQRQSYENSSVSNATVDVTSTNFGVRVGVAAFIPKGR